ncbi:hypothetical protein JRQ81_013960 [Phrynocephalus forsythii]|uniref:Uncharacterized protein n=1 Tax=Phrynocephalus forsythii TaxID=171643 RepID=A0A9Q0XXQ2_9SAUR|nr:hypothetical protein JRQ81_013960 [Phrynocephalus forsythii]
MKCFLEGGQPFRIIKFGDWLEFVHYSEADQDPRKVFIPGYRQPSLFRPSSRQSADHGANQPLFPLHLDIYPHQTPRRRLQHSMPGSAAGAASSCSPGGHFHLLPLLFL